MMTATAPASPSGLGDGSSHCPICREVFTDAFSTMCGHTYCFACITAHLEHMRTCPCCSQPLSPDALFPNLALDKLLKGMSRSGQLSGGNLNDVPAAAFASGAGSVRRTRELTEAVGDLPLDQLTRLLGVISDKHNRLVMDTRETSMNVLRDFLALSHTRKNEAIDRLEKEIGCIDADMAFVEQQLEELGGKAAAESFAKELCAVGGVGSRPTVSGETGTDGTQVAHARKGTAGNGGERARGERAGEAAASMVCEMLTTWGFTDEHPLTRRADCAGGDPSMRRYLDANNSGFYRTGGGGGAGSGPGSKRTSMEMMRGTGPGGSQQQRTLPRQPHSPTGSGSKLAAAGAVGQPGDGPVKINSAGSSGSAGSANGSQNTCGASPGDASTRPYSDSTSGLSLRGSPSMLSSGSPSGLHMDTEAASHDVTACAREEPLAGLSLSESKRRRIFDNFGNLQTLYSDIRLGTDDKVRAGANFTKAEAHGTGRGTAASSARRDFDAFSKLMSGFIKYSRLRVVGELQHSDPLNTSLSSSIVSSIEFDMKHEMFATACVSKRIQIFNFRDVCAGTSCVRGNDPVTSISTRSKPSCLSYNKLTCNHIAASDYEGVVTVWDVETNTAVAEFEEHDKRVWTVDYCRTNHRLLASGSDDGRVKIWSTNQEESVLDLDMRANVCCVQYGPTNAHQLAVGCADHRVHLFDLRSPNQALAVLSGHRKAVSYVRFLSSGDEVVSASTDSTLCLWDVKGKIANAARKGVAPDTGQGRVPATGASVGGVGLPPQPATVLEGHTNEKNFVGLSVGGGDLIACGSETNEVYVYHKLFNRPLVKYNFNEPVVKEWTPGAAAGMCGGSSSRSGGGGNGSGSGAAPMAQRHTGRGGRAAGDTDSTAPNHFISATCWRGEDPTLLAANSLGSIRVLQLVE